MKNGWICLYRKLLDDPIWCNSTSDQRSILIAMLLMAAHSETVWEWQGKKFKCGPGQFVTSLNSLAEKSGRGVTIQNVRTAINRFEKLGFLTNESTKTGRLITIVNWQKYQDLSSIYNKEPNKDLTKTQQRPNKDLTPNNNVTMKQCNNENKNNIHCSELQEPSEPKAQGSGIKMILNDKSYYDVPMDKITFWKDCYPGIDVERELRKMAAWCDSNPQKRKTKRGIDRFITNWLSREQDRGGKIYATEEKNPEYHQIDYFDGRDIDLGSDIPFQ